MILRRIVNAFRRQDWFTVFVETMIVVLGVFIGLQVNNWNAARADARIAASYIERFKADLRAEIEYYSFVSDYYEQTRAHAIAALEAYHRPAGDLGSGFLIDLYQASQQISLATRRGTYDEILAVGRIGLIADETTRTMLNNYYESAAMRKITLDRSSVADYRKVIRMQMDAAIQRQIRERCGDIYTPAEDYNYHITLPEACAIDVPAGSVQAEIEKLRANDQVRQELRFQLATIDTILGSVGNGGRTAAVALEKLEKAAP
jgi:hypothetical protein